MHHLEFYTHEELKTIIIRSAQVLGVEIDEKVRLRLPRDPGELRGLPTVC